MFYLWFSFAVVLIMEFKHEKDQALDDRRPPSSHPTACQMCVCVHSHFIQFSSTFLFLLLSGGFFFYLCRFQNYIPLQSSLFFHQLLMNVQLICVCDIFSRNINVTIFVGLVIQLNIMYILDYGNGLFSLFRMWDKIRMLTFQFCCKQYHLRPILILVALITLIAVQTDATTSNCIFHDYIQFFLFFLCRLVIQLLIGVMWCGRTYSFVKISYCGNGNVDHFMWNMACNWHWNWMDQACSFERCWKTQTVNCRDLMVHTLGNTGAASWLGLGPSFL